MRVRITQTAYLDLPVGASVSPDGNLVINGATYLPVIGLMHEETGKIYSAEPELRDLGISGLDYDADECVVEEL